MDHHEVGRQWNKNAHAWTAMGRAGYDEYRDSFNTPAFLEMLPEIKGLKGLDIGCGEGHNTRMLAEQGAQISAIDISDIFLEYASQIQPESGRIDYAQASAVELPFPKESFDFATGFMSFMDIPEIELVLNEVYRILKPGGFLQFSITHPCYDLPHRVKKYNPDGTTKAYEVGDYFRNLEGDLLEVSLGSRGAELGFTSIHIPRFTRTLSQWINAILDTGFILERINEPKPSDEIVERFPRVQDSQVVAYFLHIQCRKGIV